MSTGVTYNVDKIGTSHQSKQRQKVKNSEGGFVIAGIKDILGAPVGDTLTLQNMVPNQLYRQK